jgi:glycosyltransferase involved in cell wall biosynthesis
MTSPRLALLGAFTFPAPLGSQRFAAEQAEALRAAGADVELVVYPASGAGLRGLDSRKLGADVALGRALAAAHHARPFSAVLAHNAEAALVALALRARLRLPVVYVAHTLWAEEAESWAPLPGFEPLVRLAGRQVDRTVGRAADAVLALSEPARASLARFARGPVAHVAPGHTPEPAPPTAEIAAACARHGLAREGFALYAGNLDRYQGLDALDAAAGRVPALPVVVVTHFARRTPFRSLRVIRVTSVAETRALVHGAGVALLPRRCEGGFPIKLLHYMDAGRAILARERLAGALVHGESAWLLRDDAGPEDFAAALRRLAEDHALRARLGAGARAVLAAHHAWPARAEETLVLVRSALAPRAHR